MPPAEQVQMHVKHLLPAVCPVIHHQTVAVGGDPLRPRNLCGGEHQLAQHPLILRRRIGDHRYRFFGDYQNVNRGLGTDITKSENAFIFVYDIRRNLPANYLSEYGLSADRH